MELSEEEQIMRAIALSLGQELPPSQAGTRSTKDAAAMEEEVKKEEEVKEKEDRRKEDALIPLDTTVLDRFGDSLLEGTLGIISNVRDTVHGACGLICALVKRNGPDWKRTVLTRVKDEVRRKFTISLRLG